MEFLNIPDWLKSAAICAGIVIPLALLFFYILLRGSDVVGTGQRSHGGGWDDDGDDLGTLPIPPDPIHIQPGEPIWQTFTSDQTYDAPPHHALPPMTKPPAEMPTPVQPGTIFAPRKSNHPPTGEAPHRDFDQTHASKGG